MVDQQLQLAKRLLIRPRATQAWLSQCGTRDGERVDRVGLATQASGTTLRCHQLRRHSHQLLTSSKELSLERASQLPAILQRPQPLAVKARRPGQQPVVNDGDGRLVKHPTGLVDRDSRQRVLVYVHSDHDHSDRLLNRWGRPASGHASLEAAAKLLSGHARRSRVGGGDTTLASQPTGRHAGIESAAAARVCVAHRTPPRRRE
jgi:hypothetical protein